MELKSFFSVIKMETYLDFVNSDIAGIIFLYLDTPDESFIIFLSKFDPFRLAFKNGYIFIDKILHDNKWLDTLGEIKNQFENNYRHNYLIYFKIVEYIRGINLLLKTQTYIIVPKRIYHLIKDYTGVENYNTLMIVNTTYPYLNIEIRVDGTIKKNNIHVSRDTIKNILFKMLSTKIE